MIGDEDKVLGMFVKLGQTYISPHAICFYGDCAELVDDISPFDFHMFVLASIERFDVEEENETTQDECEYMPWCFAREERAHVSISVKRARHAIRDVLSSCDDPIT
ncbi:hypothetical protein EVAR_94402_1 [Eumeta japonica]|uniref:Uncharacterized protein n=1 Tax=Eumeta variegata TaxID=151549 RepID=A0A4C1TQ06_EUMVA|nr:hypothetical protein EVAR_94402_1 [Eumeta japonica]